MPRPNLSRLTSAHAIALLALFISLGGTSYAVTKLPKNSVASLQVKDGSLTAKDLASGVFASAAPGPRGPRGADGAAGPAGLVGPAGASGSLAPWRFAKADKVNLSPNVWEFMTVLRIRNVPAGTYRVEFAGYAELANGPEYGMQVWCQTVTEPAGRNGDPTVVSQMSGTVGEGGGSVKPPTQAWDSTSSHALADLVPLTRTEAFDVSVRCSHENNIAAGTSATVQHAKLAVLPSGEVTNVPQ